LKKTKTLHTKKLFVFLWFQANPVKKKIKLKQKLDHCSHRISQHHFCYFLKNTALKTDAFKTNNQAKNFKKNI
jgi:hypothetical protein